MFINFLFRKCSSILIANESRLDYMLQLYGVDSLKHACVVSNFENSSFIMAQTKPLSTSISSFLSGRKYIYLQNPFDLDRGIVESLSLISKHRDFCLLVSGKIPNPIIEFVTSLYGHSFIESNVFFTGWVDDLSLVSYVDNAYASVVMYKYINNPSDYHSLNNRYAASNTLYQTLCRGTPVIVGCNEGMSRIVSDLGVGIVMNDDGSSDEIIKSFEKLKCDYASIKDACVSKKDVLSWEAQERILIDAVFG
jgi:glycosyltransferase involved in cell wall biosynthesis